MLQSHKRSTDTFADRLLRSRTRSPTAEELIQADEAQRVRARELDVAFAEGTKQLRLGDAEPPPTALS